MTMEFDQLSGDAALASVSLFAGGGIGDVGIERGCKVPVISACELVPDRAGLIRHNFPDTKVFEGDVWDLVDPICEHAQETLGGRRPWLVVMSPPCQGMSSNGVGRISASIRAGNRPREDERNRLVLPGLRVVERLQPDWFVLENVRRMENTVISNENGDPENILDLLVRRLTPLSYSIRSSIVDFRGLGVPHHRQRLITIGSRIPEIRESVPPGPAFSRTRSPLHPIYHRGGPDQEGFITLREAIGDMPPLDALNNTVDPNDPLHNIPKWNEDQYFWMKHTPEGQTAFNNSSCLKCGEEDHEIGVIICRACGEFLPKPQMVKVTWQCGACSAENPKSRKSCTCGDPRPEGCELQEQRREIRGFKTSYRRLSWDSPASTLTQNSGVISSDMKGHPDQNRVLSVREILRLSSLQAHPGVVYPWDCDSWKYEFRSIDSEGTPFHGGNWSPRLIRSVIGESIPPLAMASIIGRLLELDGRADTSGRFLGFNPGCPQEPAPSQQPSLFEI